MVEYEDGSVLAQLGQPDMRTPIAYGLGFPERIASGVGVLDLALAGRLDFEQPDFEQFPCLKLSFEALRSGQGACISLNAANEIAVAAFLGGKLRYTDIASIIENTLTWHAGQPLGSLTSLDEVMALDTEARLCATQWIAS
jgi:1-deoxy-D-xylulose-5-phosphate reductoisomerase